MCFPHNHAIERKAAKQNENNNKKNPINCPHTVTKCHQELAHSLTWHLIICLQSESWQALLSEPSARLVFCCVVSAHSNHNQGTIRGDKGFLQQKVPSARATTMFLLLMPSLPIKSATVNYCNYETELSVCPPNPPPLKPLPPWRVETLRELVCCFTGASSLLRWSSSRELDEGGAHLGAHDRGDVREIARFMPGNWKKQVTANGHASSLTHLMVCKVHAGSN